MRTLWYHSQFCPGLMIRIHCPVQRATFKRGEWRNRTTGPPSDQRTSACPSVCVRSVLPSQEDMAQRFPRPLGFSRAREPSHSGNVMAPTHSSFWQFQRMVKHITGRSAFFSYYGYGCYCGLGGKGTPVDNTDRCCLAHDCCYERVKHLGCQPVLNGYQFRVVNGTVICECALGPGVSCLCGLRACECDTQSAYCFRENLPTYEKNFKQLSSRPHCGKHRPQC
uniref:Phospholipase A2 n=1 Tax=Bos indicus x Bos taurus TaxID=30522 RepID=A0A4W2DFP8_BOBOX